MGLAYESGRVVTSGKMPELVPRPIAVRCDGDATIGAGHVARCIRIALGLVDCGLPVLMVGRFEGIASNLVRTSGLPVSPATDTSAGIPEGCAGALIDHYGISRLELELAAAALPVACIVDTGPAPAVSLVLCPHEGAEELVRVPPGTTKLFGARYSPADPALIACRRPRGLETALVTFGASDSGRRLVEAAAVALLDAGVARVRAITDDAPTNPHLGPPNYVHGWASGGLLAEIGAADVAVSAAGTSAYDLACAGVPTLLVAIADNQRHLVDTFQATRVAIGLGLREGRLDDGELAAAVRQLTDQDTRSSMAEAGPRLVDGRGAQRVAERLAQVFRHSGQRTRRLGSDAL